MHYAAVILAATFEGTQTPRLAQRWRSKPPIFERAFPC
jgi:hypothetical protein